MEWVEITLMVAGEGLTGIILLWIGCSDLVDIVKLKFFQPDKYTRVSNRYTQIIDESLYNTPYTIGIILITITGLILTSVFIYSLVLYWGILFSYGLNLRKKNL